jgi:hypothetical protein
MVAGGVLELDIGQVVKPVVTIDRDAVRPDSANQVAERATLGVDWPV